MKQKVLKNVHPQKKANLRLPFDEFNLCEGCVRSQLIKKQKPISQKRWHENIVFANRQTNLIAQIAILHCANSGCSGLAI